MRHKNFKYNKILQYNTNFWVNFDKFRIKRHKNHIRKTQKNDSNILNYLNLENNL